MSTLELCNKFRIEAEGISSTGLPLEVFPEKVQQIILDLAAQENYLAEYTAVSFLSAIATALGNTYHVQIKGNWETNAALYIILVGRPGLGKTPPLEAAFTPIRKSDYEKYILFKSLMEAQSAQAEDKSKRDDKASRPILVRTIVSDFTPEALMRAHDDNKRGIVILVDEIMGMFNSVNQYNHGQLIEQLLTAYSGGALNVTRMNCPIPIHIERPCINIVGTTQTKRINELFKKGYKDNGLIDRMLFVMPKSQKISLWISVDNEADGRTNAASRWEMIVNKVLSLDYAHQEGGEEEMPTILKLSPEARILFFDWWNNILSKVNAVNDDNEVESRVMKRSTNTARLALIFQTMRWACGESHLQHVDVDSVKSAIRMSDYFEECYDHITKVVAEDAIDILPKEMLAQLPESFTSKDAIAKGIEVGMCKRKVQYVLSHLTKEKVLRKIKDGEYQKTTLA